MIRPARKTGHPPSAQSTCCLGHQEHTREEPLEHVQARDGALSRPHYLSPSSEGKKADDR